MAIEYKISKNGKVSLGRPEKLAAKLGVGYSYFMRQYHAKQPCRGYWITRSKNYSKAKDVYAYYDHDDFVAEGTYREIASYLGITESALRQLKWRNKHGIVKNSSKQLFKIDET